MNNLFALYKDDVDPEEVKKWAEQERAKIKIRQEEKERETLREKLTFEEGRTGKKEVPVSSLPQAAKETSTGVAREVTIAIILIIVAIIFGKKLLVLLKSKGK